MTIGRHCPQHQAAFKRRLTLTTIAWRETMRRTLNSFGRQEWLPSGKQLWN